MLPETAKALQQEVRDLSQRLDLEISEEEMETITRDMIKGFQESLPEDSDIEWVDPVQSFQDYLASEEAQQLLNRR